VALHTLVPIYTEWHTYTMTRTGGICTGWASDSVLAQSAWVWDFLAVAAHLRDANA